MSRAARRCIDDEAEPRLPRECEPMLGLSLDVAELLPADEQVRDQGVARKDAKVRSPVPAPRQRRVAAIAAGAYVPCPRDDDVRSQIDAGLEAVQPPPLHEIEAELAEAEPGLVVAEMRPQDHAEPAHRRSTMRRRCHARG